MGLRRKSPNLPTGSGTEPGATARLWPGRVGSVLGTPAPAGSARLDPTPSNESRPDEARPDEARPDEARPEEAADPIVVTGVGATNPLGGTVPDTWEALLAARSGVRGLDAEWAAELPVRIAAPLSVEPSEVL